MFNNDVRLRALKTLAEAMSPIEQKKAILYFSAGMQRSGQDNQVELRSAINAAVRANVAIYADRHARAAGRRAGRRRAPGERPRPGALLGPRRPAAVRAARLVAGHADVARGRYRRPRVHRLERFRRGVRARAARHVRVLPARLQQHQHDEGRPLPPYPGARRSGTACASRRGPGYYADRDFTHTSRNDREAQLDEQMFAAVSATDLPVMVTGGWFRLAADKYYVPVALTVPGSAVPVANDNGTRLARRARHGARRAQLPRRPLPRNVEAAARHGQDARRQTDPVSVGRDAAARPLLGQGRRPREHDRAQLGSFEAPIVVPELKQAAMKVSSVVLSTQLQPCGERARPTIRSCATASSSCRTSRTSSARIRSCSSTTRSTIRARPTATAPQLRTSLAFYRGKVKVFETPVVERTADRRARSARRALPVRSAGRRRSRPASTPARSTSSTRSPASSTSRACCSRSGRYFSGFGIRDPGASITPS